MTHRFFIPPEWLRPPTVILRDDTARQIKSVLRMQPDDEVIVLDNSGRGYRIRLTQLAKSEVLGEIVAEEALVDEPRLHLTLYQGILKAQKFEWVLQKGTELGIRRFVPTLCRRSIRNDLDGVKKKYPRWQRIIQEAAEQSHRSQLPQLTLPTTLADALPQILPETLILMPWEAADSQAGSLQTILRKQPIESIAIFIGPEGGFTPAEAETARRVGAHLVKLGPRILRAETASLAVAAVVMSELGDWP